MFLKLAYLIRATNETTLVEERKELSKRMLNNTHQTQAEDFQQQGRAKSKLKLLRKATVKTKEIISRMAQKRQKQQQR